MFKKNRENNDILFIDASNEFEKGKNQNNLTDENVEKIVDTFVKRETIDKYSYVATMDEIKEAAEYVNASHFIEKLPQGYEEPVSERGSTFSAGERQLLSFARTLAHKPSILVMDEATANIDTETEILIQEALEKLMKGRTTIMVAHRLSTIQHADCIMVMHKGKIREQGTHQELLAQNGIYKKLYELQIHHEVTA